MIHPGSTLGVLGGGQLGKMFVQSAHEMGYRTVVYDSLKPSLAGDIACRQICANFDDRDALKKFAHLCAAVTIEFENIPVESLRCIEQITEIYPRSDILGLAQDRLLEKNYFSKMNMPTVAYENIENEGDIERAYQKSDRIKILKTARFGYNGNGQQVLTSKKEALAFFRKIGACRCILEDRIDLLAELSIIVARNAVSQAPVIFPVAQNTHREGILHQSRVPVESLYTAAAAAARRYAVEIADDLDYFGVLAVEFMLDKDMQLYVNEIAPRPHNSGHYTINACSVSQFDLQVRTMCEMPLFAPRMLGPAVMVNLLGDICRRSHAVCEKLAGFESLQLHWYGKRKMRPSRKMGHFCLFDGSQGCVETLNRQAAAIMEELQQLAVNDAN